MASGSMGDAERPGGETGASANNPASAGETQAGGQSSIAGRGLVGRRALVSVYDKTGIVDFCRALHGEFGFEIISTGGTAKTLREAGISVTLIEDLTGFPEMLDGRVKTLHPAIHAAILADRDNPEHMRQLEAAGIKPIDMVVVNLYPFEKTVADPNCTFEQAIEMIDIGGVALLRAAAKNHRHVVVISHSDMYETKPAVWAVANFRHEMASSAIQLASGYDATIASYLRGRRGEFAYFDTVRLTAPRLVRYGENSHLKAVAYEHARFYEGDYESAWEAAGVSLLAYPKVGGGDLSYNNYLDADAALGLCAELTRAASGAHPNLWHRFSTGDCVPGFPTRVFRPVGSNVSPPVSDERWTRRNLPHLQTPGATYFVTFRLRSGQLTAPERDIVLSACTYWHKKKLILHCASVMPDHVHVLMTPHETATGEWVSRGEILHSIKRFSATKINEMRGTSGPVWMDENFDRVMRNEREFVEKWEYIEANPVTAGLIKNLPYPWFWKSESGFGDRLGGGDFEETGLETRSNSHRLKTGATGRLDSHRLETDATAHDRLEAGATGHINACIFIKHTNPCGASVGGDPIETYRRAYLADPNAAMGGILAVNFDVHADFAEAVMETYERFGKPLKEAGAAHAPGGFFLEVWVAPRFTEDAVRVIRGTYDAAAATPEEGESRLDSPPRKKWGENVRLLAVGDMSQPPDPKELSYRSIAGGMLVQSPDLKGLNEDEWKVVTNRQPTDAELDDLRLAWLISKHTKSNAISIVKDGMLLGNGAGQMSRVMSCRIATWLAKENGHAEKLPGSVAASDAFFPFADGPQILIDAGVTALIQPGGSKRDDDTIRRCDERNIAMIFTGTRHFRH